VKRASRDFRLPLYLGPILLLTLPTTAGVLYPLDGLAPLTGATGFAITALISASALAVALVNLAVTLFYCHRVHCHDWISHRVFPTFTAAWWWYPLCSAVGGRSIV